MERVHVTLDAMHLGWFLSLPEVSLYAVKTEEIKMIYYFLSSFKKFVG